MSTNTRGIIDRLGNIHEAFIGVFHDFRPKHPFVIKKLSDYYISRMLPDFFYVTPYRSSYYSTMVAARVTISSLFLIAGLTYLYKNNIKPYEENQKKYRFNFFTQRYLNYEKELLLFEKYSKDKYIM